MLQNLQVNQQDPYQDELFPGTENNDVLYSPYRDAVYMKGGDDNFQEVYKHSSVDVVYGGNGKDTVFAGSQEDLLYGENGNDSLHGEEGDDFIDGGNDDDFLVGGVGNDTIFGGNGNDTLNSGDGRDYLDGGSGNDILESGNDNDTLIGGDGNDYLSSSRGENLVYGGLGKDSLVGGSISFESDPQTPGAIELYKNIFVRNSLFGEEGNDVFILSNINSTGELVRYNIKNGINDYAYIRDFKLGEDKIQITNDVSNYSLSRIENDVNGVSVNETNIYYLDDLIAKVNGNIELNSDYFIFAQFDTADYSTAKAAVFADLNLGTATTTNAQGNTEEDTLIGIEQIDGSNYDDRLIGNAQGNTLVGNNGNDTLVGNAGADVLDGGEGIDLAEFFTANAAIVADLNLGTATTTNAQGSTEKDTLISIEQIFGSNFDDTLIGDAQSNVLVGGLGNDSLMGGEGYDQLDGGAGADTINGGEGIDRASYSRTNAAVTADLNLGIATTTNAQGNTEQDTLISIEQLFGGNFDDTLIGDVQENILVGSVGNDSLIGGEGNDNLRGDTGADTLDGGKGIDHAAYWTANAGVIADLNLGTATTTNAQGNTETDTLISIEQLFGSNFNDQLVGDDGSNALIGHDGDDVLLGGKGYDILAGGNGADIFAFTSPDQVFDRINDFNSTEGDKIQISANGFGGNLVAGLLNADHFVLGSASVDTNDRFIFNQNTGRLSFDTDGSGTLEAVEIATFYNNIVLSHSDIFIV